LVEIEDCVFSGHSTQDNSGGEAPAETTHDKEYHQTCRPAAADQTALAANAEMQPALAGTMTCKSRSNNPSLKRPSGLAAPERNCGS
jgi:hypothetical protein